MIDFVTWPPLQINKGGTKRWPSDKVNHSCENALRENIILTSWPSSISNVLVTYNFGF